MKFGGGPNNMFSIGVRETVEIIDLSVHFDVANRCSTAGFK